MKKLVTATKEKSMEKRSLGSKETMEKSLKERKIDPIELVSDKNKKSAMLQKNSFAKKDNLKKLSLAIATYFDSSKVGDRVGHPSSTKNEDSKHKKLPTAKISSLIDGHKAIMTLPSNFDHSSRLPTGSLLKAEDKTYMSQPRPGSISVTKAKRDVVETKQDSYRFIAKDNLEEKQKMLLSREKTIPKLITAGDQSAKLPGHLPSNSFILNSQNVKNFKGSSMFKACINSISRKIDRLPMKENKPKKSDKSATLNSVTQLSSKAEESISRGYTGMQEAGVSRGGLLEHNLNNSFSKPQVGDHHHFLASSTYGQSLTNKENELTRINNTSVSASQPKTRDSRRPTEETSITKQPTDGLKEERSYKPLGKATNPGKKTITAQLSKQKSGEYDFSSESSKFRELANSKIKHKLTEKPKEEDTSKRSFQANKLDIHKLHSRIKSSRLNKEDIVDRDDLSDTVKVEQSATSSRKTFTAVYHNLDKEGLVCEEAEIRVSLRIDTKEKYESTEKISVMSQGLSTLIPEEQSSLGDTETLKQLLLSEQDYQFNPHYLDTTGTHIKWNMRAILLNWIVEVSEDFGLKRSTYHYAANYVDRYLAVTPDIPVKNLQLLGLTALDLATKLEEIFIPGLKDFALVALNNYSVKDIQRMELNVLKVTVADEGSEMADKSSHLLHLGQLVHLPLGHLHQLEHFRHQPHPHEVEGAREDHVQRPQLQVLQQVASPMTPGTAG